ncbi:hypothetical protein L195_g008392 [Trifolium pratense]|uniref:RNase H type-1 domain-containing protein n=1 Tax=Trifolium pratense TaxID=57577 RepID=A0A2K3P924_TRIPR|nr:hypothetical protein L195_g008392 [Trifolium pratense]
MAATGGWMVKVQRQCRVQLAQFPEALALMEAMQSASNRHLERIVYESDSQLVVNAVHAN